MRFQSVHLLTYFSIFSVLLAFSIKASALISSEKIFNSQNENFKVETLTTQKDVIWGFDFISDHEIIFTERSGVLKLLNLKTKNVSEISGAPAVWARGQGGLLDVAVNPNKKNEVYLSYSRPEGKAKASTAVGYGIIETAKLKSFKTIFTAFDANDEEIHFGSRIVFDGKGHIYFSVGDRDERDKAQNLSFHNGKIMRLKLDGSVPEDNPFTKSKNAKPEIWSLGHRNPQGLVFDKLNGKLWEAEFGPRGGDELNLIERGGNYGWPKVTYGREYWGPSIGVKDLKGFAHPIEHWVPSISPSGLMIYSGKQFKNWSGNIFLANLNGSHLRRLKIENNKVLVQEVLLDKLGIRFRQVKQGPEGHIYYSTDGGELARIIPAN